jgi:NTE family protein
MSRKLTALALQGGGSHGAYTWGVLDRLLEDRSLALEAISGASAGAMNAVVLAHGYTSGGRDGAREALDAFWNAVSAKLGAPAIGATPSALWPDAAKTYLSITRYFSPYQLNPLNVNPLRDILEEQVDFDRLRAQCKIRLFVSATRVRDGALRLFTNEDLTLDALLASASIPSLHHSVEIDGDAYWDGGLTANPPVSPLVYQCKARDIIVVVLNPAGSDEVPATADAIHERFTQVSFSSALASELQGIALAKAEAARARFCVGRVDRRLKGLRLHIIDSAEYMAELDPASRLNADSSFVLSLRDQGRSRAEAWLARRGAQGLHSSGAKRGADHASGKSERAAG